MDQYERFMARARAEWRAKRAGKTTGSLSGRSTSHRAVTKVNAMWPRK